MERRKSRVGREAESGGDLPPGVVLSESGGQRLDYVVAADGISFQSGPKGLKRRVNRTLIFAWDDIAWLDLAPIEPPSTDIRAPKSVLCIWTKSGRVQPVQLSATEAEARSVLLPYWPVLGRP